MILASLFVVSRHQHLVQGSVKYLNVKAVIGSMAGSCVGVVHQNYFTFCSRKQVAPILRRVPGEHKQKAGGLKIIRKLIEKTWEDSTSNVMKRKMKGKLYKIKISFRKKSKPKF